MNGVLVATLTLMGTAAAQPDSAEIKRYALVVANNGSLDPDVRPLRYADDDGLRYAEVFRLMGADVFLLTDIDSETARSNPQSAKSASRDNLLHALTVINGRIATDRRLGRRSDFYFVYTGHGAVDDYGEGYLNLADARLTRSDLFDAVLSPSQATYNHVIVDACQSYFLVRSRGDDEDAWTEDRADIDIKRVLGAYHASRTADVLARTGMFLSTSSDQKSHEWDVYASGVFSHEIRSGLLGAADVNRDGNIEYVELEAYLGAANAGVTDTRAKIEPFVRAPMSRAGQRLGSMPPRARRLTIAAGASGHLYLEDEDGKRYVDFNNDVGSVVTIALAANKGYWLRSKDGELAIPSTGNVSLSKLEFQPSSFATRGTIGEALRRQLYNVPFGASFFQGFVQAQQR